MKPASLFIFSPLLLAASCSRDPSATTPDAASSRASTAAACDTNTAVAAENTVQVPVEGMTCAACAGTIKETLAKVAGVKSSEVRLAERDVLVRVAGVTPECLVATINGIGDYKAGTPKVVTP